MIDESQKLHLEGTGDLVLQEIWRIKDSLSAARGHDLHRLFAGARERQQNSGHAIASFQIPIRDEQAAL